MFYYKLFFLSSSKNELLEKKSGLQLEIRTDFPSCYHRKHNESSFFTRRICFFFRFRQSRFNARRIRKRVVFKHGDCNVVQGNVAKRRRKYLQDIFTTLVDAQWRWTLLVFAMNFLLSWLLFAVVWWLIVFTHGDLSDEHLVSISFEFI